MQTLVPNQTTEQPITPDGIMIYHLVGKTSGDKKMVPTGNGVPSGCVLNLEKDENGVNKEYTFHELIYYKMPGKDKYIFKQDLPRT